MIFKDHTLSPEGEGSVYDKLKIFEQCNKEDENYVYFDLDVVIKDTIDVVRDEFTLLYVGGDNPIILHSIRQSCQVMEG